MGIVCPLAQAAVSAWFLIKQTVFSVDTTAESLEIAGLWGQWIVCRGCLSLFGIVRWWVRYSIGWLHPVHIGLLWTRPLNSAAAQAACVLWSLRLGSWKCFSHAAGPTRCRRLWEVRPLPVAFEVIHPVPPQTSKRGGYVKSDLCGILFSGRCSYRAKTQKESTKSHPNLSYSHRSTSNLPF